MTRPKVIKTEPTDKAERATKAELQRRITAIYKLNLQGASRAEIIEYAIDKWHIAEPTIDVYIAKARALFDEHVTLDRDNMRKLAEQRLNMIFYKTMKVMDYQRAIAAQREINLLFGLYAPQKQEVKVIEEISIDEHRNRIAELLNIARIREAGKTSPGGIRTTDD